MTDNREPTVYSGPFAHTSRVKHLLTTELGDSSPVELVRSIDTNTDPDLLFALMEGTLHTVVANGKTYHLAVPVVCHDIERRVLALIVPEALCWDEFRLRKDLLDAMTQAAVKVPAYARNFHVLTSAAQFADLAGDSEAKAEAEDVTQITTSSAEDLAASKELARKRAELEAEAARIRVEREQLNEVRKRFDREREQLDQLSEELGQARTELDGLRQQLNLEQLNREAQALRAQSGTAETREEATQVVTDDQFIEVVDVSNIELAAVDSVVQMDVDAVTIAEIEVGVPGQMSEILSSSIQSAVKIVNSRVLALAQIDADRVKRLFNGDPSFFLQLHEVNGYPIVSILLAQLDDRDQVLESYAWPLDPAPDGDRLILESLRDRTKLRVAFYGPTGKRLRAVEIAAPLSANVAWILERSAELLSMPGRDKYPSARQKFEQETLRLGTMRHNFTASSFDDARSPSELKLAAGIVGYWSKTDTFQYLIANRSFPLTHFRQIQQRVVRRATSAGIFINRPLRKIAMEIGLCESEPELAARLIANFAEASISIRENDLEPAEQWDNWDALLGLGEELGVPPDPDVVELAEVSLKRAQEAEDLDIRSEGSDVTRTVEDTRRAASPQDSLIIAKRSESTGITYFLPNDAVLDTFDDLAQMSREDLELLLHDNNGRLEAAQMLIERFGVSATSRALEATEEMPDSEVEAMAQFIESKAGGLEAELVRCVESSDVNGMYVAGRGLAAVKSTSAIPTLIDALQDDNRATSRDRFAVAIAEYGDKLMPALTRVIKRDGPNDALILLLNALEDRSAGTLSKLSKDRSKNLREAARLARKLRESESA